MSSLTITLPPELTTPAACTPVPGTPVAAAAALAADIFDGCASGFEMAAQSPTSVSFTVSPLPTDPVVTLPESDESPRAAALYPTAWNAPAGVTSEQLAEEAGLPPAPSLKATLIEYGGVALNLVAIGVSIAAAVVLGMLVSAALSSIFYGILGLLALGLIFGLICRLTAKDGIAHKASKFVLNQGLHAVGTGLCKLGEFVWQHLPSMPHIPVISRFLNRA